MSTATTTSTANPRTIRLADCPPQPWKNGGGTTRELLVWPNSTDWTIRISVADITQDGVFSRFEGVARSFAVIEGAGVVLHFADRTETVTQTTAPVQFDGADAPNCTLIQGATQDLNLMCRAGHSATLIPAYGGQTLQARGFFDKSAQTLVWCESPCELATPQGVKDAEGELLGWWVV